MSLKKGRMGINYGRPRGREDWQAIRELCGRTAEQGRGIPEERWPFFGEFWVGPYQRILPRWTYAAFDGDRVVGYLTGCPDTASFERWSLLAHRLPLFLKTVLGLYPANEDSRRFVRRFLGLEKSLFTREQRRELLSRCPAHLHVNVDEAYRGARVGKSLMLGYFDDLRKAGVPGVHLVCGKRPVGFYEKLGFRTLVQADAVFAMGLTL